MTDDSTIIQPVWTAITVGVFAGGRGVRMGRDKMRMRLGDGPRLLERAVRVGADVGPVVVLGRERPDDWSGPTARFLVDRQPGLGPLGGLVTGLADVGGPLLVLAGDMPLVRGSDLHWLVEAWAMSARTGGLIASRDGEPEPLFAIYTPAVVPTAERRITEGRRSLKGLVAELDLPTVDVPASIAPRLANLNRPEDVAALDNDDR